MVVFDASILLFVFDENTPSSVDRAKERVEYLISRLSDAGDKIVIPTPALSECLVYAGPAASDYLTILAKQSCFRVASFDVRAAVEVAARTFDARQRGQRKGGKPDASKTKIKYDRQIVAVAAVEGATAIYSDDEDLLDYAREAGMEAYQLSDLPLPPEDPQTALAFELPSEESLEEQYKEVRIRGGAVI